MGSTMKPKTIFITGCSLGGLGDAFAQEFHRRGLRVFASARNLSKVAHLKGLGIETVELDVISQDSINAAVRHVSSATSGKLDFLLNNSGVLYNMPVLDVDISAAKALFDVNFFAVLAVTQAFMPLLVKSQGVVINNTSVVAVLAAPFQSIYNASKAAAAMLTNNMRIEFAPLGVKVIDLRTGAVKSNIFENMPVAASVIPANSLYLPAKKEIEMTMTGKTLGENQKMDQAVYAKKVADDVLKRSPRSASWRGGMATIVWLLTSISWYGALDGILTRGMGLEKIKREHYKLE